MCCLFYPKETQICDTPTLVNIYVSGGIHSTSREIRSSSREICSTVCALFLLQCTMFYIHSMSVHIERHSGLSKETSLYIVGHGFHQWNSDSFTGYTLYLNPTYSGIVCTQFWVDCYLLCSLGCLSTSDDFGLL